MSHRLDYRNPCPTTFTLLAILLFAPVRRVYRDCGIAVVRRRRTHFMKRAFSILLAGAIHVSAGDLPKTPAFGDGTFVGLEPMPGYHDPETPKDRWFHQNTLTIKGRDVTLHKIPVSYYKGKKWYSASDGGFYTYTGTLTFSDGHWHLELLLTESDYVKESVGKNGKPIPPQPQQFPITRMKDGSLQADKVTYRPSKPQ